MKNSVEQRNIVIFVLFVNITTLLVYVLTISSSIENSSSVSVSDYVNAVVYNVFIGMPIIALIIIIIIIIIIVVVIRNITITTIIPIMVYIVVTLHKIKSIYLHTPINICNLIYFKIQIYFIVVVIVIVIVVYFYN